MLQESDLKDLDVDESDTHLEAMKRFSDFTKFHSSVLHSPLSIYIRGKYCRSENFRVIKLSCFKFSYKNIFVVLDTHEKFFDGMNRFYVPRFSDLEQDCTR